MASTKPHKGAETGPEILMPAMTGSEMKSLRDALVSAFDPASFDQMLRLRLDKDRAALVGNGAFQIVAFELIELAVREGWVLDLIRAAREDNPGNPALQRFCAEHPQLFDERDTGPKHGPRYEISRIDRYAPAELIGREAETKLLTNAWDQAVRGETKRPHVITIVALGGEGKTSLVAKWAADLAYQGWPGCEAVYAWSFYSQGTREQMAASSDLFLKDALTFFGDTDDWAFAASNAGAYAKGQRLARVVGSQRALLILDGLEPLQYAPTAPTGSGLKDQGIAALIRGLATHSRSLCVVTTRYSVPDLNAFRQTTAPEQVLKRLSRAAGVHLLKVLGVKGSELRTTPFGDGNEKVNEFEKLVEEVKGHALTLTLLGSYLAEFHAGDIRQRDRVKLDNADDEAGGRAFRVMDAYVESFKTGGHNEAENTKGKRALAVLRLLGLFDRPATADCLHALWKPPAIPGLTDLLFEVDDKHRTSALSRLDAAKLLTVNRDAASLLVSLDAHPLIREYFAKQLREKYSDAWRAGHKRLYEHLCATTREGDKPTLEDLQPLYQAMSHGCQAGLERETCDEVYRNRIVRGTEIDGFYSTRRLGAFGADLGVLASFFEHPWSHVSSALSVDDQGWILNAVATCLRALGRLVEARELMLAALGVAFKLRDWRNLAISAGNLSELGMVLGDVIRAVRHAKQAVAHSDRIDDLFERIARRTICAAALQQSGRGDEAIALFCEAEAIQPKWQPERKWLYARQGFRYCDLLLTEPEHAAWRVTLQPSPSPPPSHLPQACQAVYTRGECSLEWAIKQNVVLDIALDSLTMGRATLYQAVLEGTSLKPCHDPVQNAVDNLLRAGQQPYLPLGLLTRAWLRALTGPRAGPDSAQADLDDAWDIAERGPMPLYMSDIHLHRARLFFREEHYPWESPQHDLAEARRLIVKCGYWRRKEELEDAEKAILTDAKNGSATTS
jgi:tetratricopeptide (TPR) repeat protein